MSLFYFIYSPPCLGSAFFPLSLFEFPLHFKVQTSLITHGTCTPPALEISYFEEKINVFSEQNLFAFWAEYITPPAYCYPS